MVKLCLLLSLGFAHAATPKSDESAVINRLRAIENEIRARAAEAEAEVARTRGEAQRITDDANRRAKEIRDEADEYVRKVQEHIEEIKRGMPGHAPASVTAPTREELTKRLNGAVDSLLACWGRKNTEACALEKLRAAIATLLPPAS